MARFGSAVRWLSALIVSIAALFVGLAGVAAAAPAVATVEGSASAAGAGGQSIGLLVWVGVGLAILVAGLAATRPRHAAGASR